MNNLDLLIPHAAAKSDTWLWATITQVDPLRVRLDGDDVSLDLTPEYLFPGEPPLGARVWVQVNGRRVIVHGPTKGVDFGPDIVAAENRAMIHAETEIAVAMESIPGDIEAAEAAAKAHAEQVLATEVAAIEASIGAGDQAAMAYAEEQVAARAAIIAGDIAATEARVNGVIDAEVAAEAQNRIDAVLALQGDIAAVNDTVADVDAALDATTTIANNATAGVANLEGAVEDLTGYATSGVNLLPDSKRERTYGGRFYSIYVREVFAPYVGQTITFSFDIKATIPSTESTAIGVYPYQYVGISIEDSMAVKVTTDWTRHSITTPIKDWGYIEGYSGGEIGFYDGDNPDQVLTVRRLKIELGLAASPWTPHSDDAEARFVSVEESLTALDNELGPLQDKFPIAGTDIQDGAISTEKMSANSINGDRILANTLGADRIMANSITGDRIRANSITVDKLTVGSIGDNIIVNGNFRDRASDGSNRPHTWVAEQPDNCVVSSYEVGADTYLSIATSATPGGTVYQGLEQGAIRVSRGEQFHVEVGASSGGGDHPFSLLMHCYDRDGGYVEFVSTQGSFKTNDSGAAFPASNRCGAVLTVPNKAQISHVRFGLAVWGANTTYLFDKYVVGKVSVSARIADGAVVADKIAANAVTANKLNVVMGGGNLIPNSSFQNPLWAREGWSTFVEPTIETDPQYVRFGTQALSLPAGDQPVYRLIEGLTPGQTYMFSAYIYNSQWTDGPKGKIVIHDGADGNVGTTFSTKVGEWERVTYKYVANSTRRAMVHGYAGYTGRTVFDGFQLEEGDVATAYAPKTDEILPGTIVAPMISAGAVETDALKADAVVASKIAGQQITTKHLAVGDFANYAIDFGMAANRQEFPNDAVWLWSGDLGDRVPWRLHCNPPTDSQYNYHRELSKKFEVRGGDEFWIDVEKFADDCNFHVLVGLRTYNAQGNVVNYIYAGVNGIVLTNDDKWNWVARSGKAVIPNDNTITHAMVEVQSQAQGTNYSGGMYLRSLRVRRRNAGSLVVDGAITANKVAADAITADKVAADAITAKHTITGATIQTDAAANVGVKIVNGGLIAYGADGNPTLVVDGDTGALAMKGALTSGSTVTGATITGGTLQTQAEANRGIKITSTGLAAYNAAGVTTLTINAENGGIAIIGSLLAGSNVTGATITGGVVQTTLTANRGIKIVNDTLTAYDAAGNATLTVDGSTGAVAMKGTLTSGSTITGATISGGKVETVAGNGSKATLESGSLKMFSNLAGEVATGGMTAGSWVWNGVTAAQTTLESPRVSANPAGRVRVWQGNDGRAGAEMWASADTSIAVDDTSGLIHMKARAGRILFNNMVKDFVAPVNFRQSFYTHPATASPPDNSWRTVFSQTWIPWPAGATYAHIVWDFPGNTDTAVATDSYYSLVHWSNKDGTQRDIASGYSHNNGGSAVVNMGGTLSGWVNSPAYGATDNYIHLAVNHKATGGGWVALRSGSLNITFFS